MIACGQYIWRPNGKLHLCHLNIWYLTGFSYDKNPILGIERHQSFAAILWGLGPLLQVANSATVIELDTHMSKPIYTKL